MQVTVSAPGKIHLLGEHAVVYGKPALIAAINRRLYVTLKIRNPKSEIRNNKERIKINTDADKKLLNKAIEVFKKSYKLDKLPALEITVTSQIPVGSGLGSSAALSVALIGALMKAVAGIWNPNRINELAFEVEKFQHGNPSGGDNTAVTFGGLVWYRREFDFLKSIWSLPMVNYQIPPFVLIDTGKPEETTGEMVKMVKELSENKKVWFEKILTDQELQTKKILLALKKGDKEGILQSIKQGEKNLEKIRVVGDFAKKIIRTVERLGGAAKISGAGGIIKGSGYLLCYHKDYSRWYKISKLFHIVFSQMKLGEEGVRIEECH